MSHTEKTYDARIIDLEYMYPLEDGMTDEKLIAGLKNLKAMIKDLSLSEN